jgi:hypothetical protein
MMPTNGSKTVKTPSTCSWPPVPTPLSASSGAQTMNVIKGEQANEICLLLDEAVVRGIRWDLVSGSLVLDVDFCPSLESTPPPQARGWLIVRDAADLRFDLEWSNQEGGFTILDLRIAASDESCPREWTLTCVTDSPPGTLSVAGNEFVLVHSSEVLETAAPWLTWSERSWLASDEALLAAVPM